ncbi:MAG: glycerol-3-phosphate acyltransferase, partial [Myxococcota bacterium]
LRDLLKFEFFFPPKDEFCAELQREVSLHETGWESGLGGNGAEGLELLRRFRPFSSHRVLRPFLEAYQVVGEVLAQADPSAEIETEPLLNRCLGLGRQYVLQQRIRSPESVSKVLFQTALELARNRDLVEPGATDLRERREAFAEELRGVVRRIEAVDALAASRRAGLID